MVVSHSFILSILYILSNKSEVNRLASKRRAQGV